MIVSQQKVEGYLDNLPDPERIKGVAMDMHEPFGQTVQMCLPQAKEWISSTLSGMSIKLWIK